ncbi:hypothetical protein PEPS_00270 [Persicobacter psychrovividus]|uniref:Uncharacterized protein n=1 Tax=Persicobacter psychrovividus TaxID=387638 RepID=A0ABN6L903_9BACT|nr:hypothetical protein PEPS_00270 [Persicobacter psychrovividus]
MAIAPSVLPLGDSSFSALAVASVWKGYCQILLDNEGQWSALLPGVSERLQFLTNFVVSLSYDGREIILLFGL